MRMSTSNLSGTNLCIVARLAAAENGQQQPVATFRYPVRQAFVQIDDPTPGSGLSRVGVPGRLEWSVESVHLPSENREHATHANRLVQVGQPFPTGT